MGNNDEGAPVVFTPEQGLETLVALVREGAMPLDSLVGYAFGLRASARELQARVAELEKFAEELQREGAAEQTIICKLEDRVLKMMTTMAEVEGRITVFATPEVDPVMVDRDEAMLWTVMLNNGRHCKPDRIRELAIATFKAQLAFDQDDTSRPLELAMEGASSALWAEIERVLKEQKYEEAVERDLKLYGEVTDGTMFANPPRDIGQEVLDGVRELKEKKDEP